MTRSLPHNMPRRVAAIALAFVAGGALSQQTITVPDDVPNLTLALNPGVSGLATGDTIVLRDTVSYAGTFSVTTPGITIKEAPGDNVVLDAFGTGSVLTVNIGAGGALTLEGLTLRNGDSSGSNGGAINVVTAGTLTIRDCAFNNNAAHAGGAIYSIASTLTIENSTFTDNNSTLFGGAVRSSGTPSQPVTIIGCTFTGNDALGGNGGAIDHAGSGSPLSVTDCTFANNTCTANGGALFAASANSALVEASTFLDNIALGTASQDTGGAIFVNVPSVTLDDCDFERNLSAGSGGGVRFSNSAGDIIDCRFIENASSSAGALQVVGQGASADVYNCVFDANSARRTGTDSAAGGGAVTVNSFSARAAFYNCLFTNNSATTGGAITAFDTGILDVYNCTFVGNDADALGGAIRRSAASAAVIANSSIFFGNIPAASQVAINGSGTDEVNYSLVEGGYAAPGVGNIDANPMFTDASNGDYSLMSGSPAIDAGSSIRYLGGPLSDLAGNDRGQDDPDTADTGEVVIGAAIDIGAFEFSPDAVANCPADQNFDGFLSPADFGAWIQNYNAGCN